MRVNVVAEPSPHGSAEESPTPRNFALRLVAWVCVLGLAAAAFFAFYLRTPLRPGADPVYPLGWYGWSDQGAYLREARAVAAGNLDAYVPEIRDGRVVTHEIYYYPLGYPFIGSLFTRIVPKDPFVIPNLISYLAVVACLFQIGLVRFGSIGAFLAVVALMASPFTELTVIPWTSTPGAVATAHWAYIGLARRQLGWVHPAIGAILLGVTFASRGGGELLLLAPVILGVFWRFRREPLIARKLAVVSLIFLALVTIDLIATVRIFGTVVQPYFREVTGLVGFDISAMPRSIWHTLVHPGPGGLGWPSLLMRAPWLALAIVGAVVILRSGSPKTAVDAGLIGGFLLSLVIVGSFKAFNAGCLQFYCLHYLKMWFPIMSMYAVASLLSLRFAREFLLRRDSAHFPLMKDG